MGFVAVVTAATHFFKNLYEKLIGATRPCGPLKAASVED
jgi:hypothetical protein